MNIFFYMTSTHEKIYCMIFSPLIVLLLCMAYSLYRISLVSSYQKTKKSTHPKGFGLAFLESLNLRRVQRHDALSPCLCVSQTHCQQHDMKSAQQDESIPVMDWAASHEHASDLNVKPNTNGLKFIKMPLHAWSFEQALPWVVQRRCWKSRRGPNRCSTPNVMRRGSTDTRQMRAKELPTS